MSALAPIFQLWIVLGICMVGYLALYGICILGEHLWHSFRRERDARERYERDWPESETEVRG